MTRPVWRPHQVRDQINTITVQKRTYTTIRNSDPSPPVGPGQGLPTFAAATFHWPSTNGPVVSGISDARTIRWTCSLIAISVDVTSWATNFSLTVYQNGVAIAGLNPTGNLTAAGNTRFIINPISLIAYADTLAVNATTPGTGNTGILISAECV